MSVAENKAVVNRYFEEAHNGRAVAVLDEIIAPGLLGPTRTVVAAFQTAFPDYRITIVAQLGEEDVVASVWHTTGTHEGEWSSPMGPIAPTGKPISFTGTTTLRVADGQIVEVVGTNHDHLGILQQMGALPAGQPRPGA
ncbi:MAG: ester cyclase [Chloroflexi bacterium]|nr:ester cyclase [Chloroflexota bacterium]